VGKITITIKITSTIGAAKFGVIWVIWQIKYFIDSVRNAVNAAGAIFWQAGLEVSLAQRIRLMHQ